MADHHRLLGTVILLREGFAHTRSIRRSLGGRGTEISVEASYEPPSGALGRVIALAVGQEPSQQVERELRRLKQVLEVGDVVEGAPSTP